MRETRLEIPAGYEMDEMERCDGHWLWLVSGLRSGHQNRYVSARPPDMKLVYVQFSLWAHSFVFSFPGKM